jgi:hypothetical protein
LQAVEHVAKGVPGTEMKDSLSLMSHQDSLLVNAEGLDFKNSGFHYHDLVAIEYRENIYTSNIDREKIHTQQHWLTAAMNDDCRE